MVIFHFSIGINIMQHLQHIMIDIETLDTKPSSIILSIAAVEFDINNSGNILNSFHVNVDQNSQSNRSASPSTIEFWNKQPIEKREAMLVDMITLDQALVQLREWLPKHTKYKIWANSPSFDLSILDHAFDYASPWDYWQSLDVRTYKELARSLKIQLPEIDKTKAHNALYDCHYQAYVVSTIFSHLHTGYLYG